MSWRRKKTCLFGLLGVTLYLSACASSHQVEALPRLVSKDTSKSLIPPGYLSASGQEAVDPRLAQEIQAFLNDSGILLGFPADTAAEVPVVLNQPVQSYLKHFSRSQKTQFEHYLARSGRYLGMMRRILQEHGLPGDLVYLALVESGFNPWARSPAEAVGPWQFIEGTARRYGLKINEWVDERRDPEKSTRAAARYLKDLYRQFGCWYLAAAGYNAGEKRVESTVARLGARDFWAMARQHLLPKETCNYVPQFIAAALIARNPSQYGFTNVAYQRPPACEHVKLPGGTDLRWFAKSLKMSYEEFREFNPELKKPFVPLDQEEYLIRVPRHKKREAQQLKRASWHVADSAEK